MDVYVDERFLFVSDSQSLTLVCVKAHKATFAGCQGRSVGS